MEERHTFAAPYEGTFLKERKKEEEKFGTSNKLFTFALAFKNLFLRELAKSAAKEIEK